MAVRDRVDGEQADEDAAVNSTVLDRPEDGIPPVTVIAAIHQPNYEVSNIPTTSLPAEASASVLIIWMCFSLCCFTFSLSSCSLCSMTWF